MVHDNAVKNDALWMMTALKINPVFHLLEMYRACFATGLAVAADWPIRDLDQAIS